MKGFIEVKTKGSMEKILLPVREIERVCEVNGGSNAIIVTESCKFRGYGFTTHESYAEVVEKIKEAVE